MDRATVLATLATNAGGKEIGFLKRPGRTDDRGFPFEHMGVGRVFQIVAIETKTGPDTNSRAGGSAAIF